MNTTRRIFLAVGLGFVVGMSVGPVSVLAIQLRYVLRSNEEWPEFDREYLIALAISSIPAGMNGAIGAGLAVRRGSCDRSPVSVLPAILHIVVGVGALAMEPLSFVGFQLYALAFTVVIWSADRLGQRVGCAFATAGRLPPAEPVRPPVE